MLWRSWTLTPNQLGFILLWLNTKRGLQDLRFSNFLESPLHPCTPIHNRVTHLQFSKMEWCKTKCFAQEQNVQTVWQTWFAFVSATPLTTRPFAFTHYWTAVDSFWAPLPFGRFCCLSNKSSSPNKLWWGYWSNWWWPNHVAACTGNLASCSSQSSVTWLNVYWWGCVWTYSVVVMVVVTCDGVGCLSGHCMKIQCSDDNVCVCRRCGMSTRGIDWSCSGCNKEVVCKRRQSVAGKTCLAGKISGVFKPMWPFCLPLYIIC